MVAGDRKPELGRRVEMPSEGTAVSNYDTRGYNALIDGSGAERAQSEAERGRAGQSEAERGRARRVETQLKCH